MKVRIMKYAAAGLAVTACAAVLFGVVAYYYGHDPSDGGAPVCAFRYLTGYDCPGCGSQRAFHALLHGRVAEAWGYNPFVFFAVPAAVFYVIVEAGRRRWPRFHAGLTRPAVLLGILLAIAAYWVARNL